MLLAQLLLINACFSGDIMGLVCHMISQDRMIKRSRDFFHKEAIEKKHTQNLPVRPKTGLGSKTRS